MSVDRWRWGVLATFLLLLAQALPAAEIHVSPRGNDAESGALDHPLQTLGAAQKAARAAKAGGAVTVVIHQGTYYLPEPLIFTEQDSGSKAAAVIYTAAKGESPVISGAVPLQLTWTPYRDGIVQAKTPDGLVIDQLFVNGVPQPMARYPNYDPKAEHFNGSAADAVSPQRVARWSDPTGGYVHALHGSEWGSLHYRILGKEGGKLNLEGGWQTNRPSPMHDRFRFVEGIFEELDAPGEWFHDRKRNILYYMPARGVDLSTAKLETVRLTNLVEFRGNADHPVQFMVLSGLHFTQAARTFMQTRETLLRTDWAIYRGGAILFDGAADCALTDCTLDHLGGNAVFVSDYDRRIHIERCHLQNLGASAILFVGDPKAVRPATDPTPGPQSENYPADCLVSDCLIHQIGRVEKQVAGVDIDMAMAITVRHCSIYETPRSGINIGDGCWGGNVIEFCDVFDTVLETGDHGSFNSWGRDRYWNQPGIDMNQLTRGAMKDLPRLDATQPNILRNNRWRCDHGWDIDLDDGSSNYEIRDNLCLAGGLKNREGFYRTVENNVIVNNSFHPHVWFAGSEDVFERNIVFAPYRPIGMPTPWGKQVDFNLLQAPGEKSPKPATELQKQSGRDSHSIMADAVFVDAGAGDYRVKDESPALALGFVNFPMTGFGVESPTLRRLARSPEIPDTLGHPPKRSASARSEAVARWLGAEVKNVVGLGERSAAGLPGEIGIRIVSAAPNSRAAIIGLRANDVILKLGDHPTDNASELFDLSREAEGHGKVSLQLWRNQMATSLDVEFAASDDIGLFSQRSQEQPTIDLRISHEESEEPGFSDTLKLSDGCLSAGRHVLSNRSTNNDPLDSLTDGKLAPGYGPAFPNGVNDGKYKVDLGAVSAIAQVNTYAFNQSGQRGHQRFSLYGSASDADPGWNVSDAAAFTLIARVDTTDARGEAFSATSIARTNGALGRFRWLVWAVAPVTPIEENTAYQEFQVLPMR